MSKPAILSPVARSLAVNNPARTEAFYRNVLDFEIRSRDGSFEATYGPARLEFEFEAAPKLEGVYFEVDELEAMQVAIAARGGNPAPIVQLNWVRLYLFEIRDPDGHTLYFGKSYDEPDPSTPRPMFCQALPNLPVRDVAAAVEYYRDVLGFTINYQQDDLGVMNHGRITLVLVPRTERHTHGVASFYIRDADFLYDEYTAKKAFVKGAPVSYPWGLRTFRIADPDGNELIFHQTFE
jgi:catechol 2,3-dioxygenase-like lactoylglutathione lyase family enzyme